MTAVEWLVKRTGVHLTDFWKEEIQQALEMEKQQIETLKNSILELFEMVHNGCNIDDKIRANEIYCETYKTNNQ